MRRVGAMVSGVVVAGAMLWAGGSGPAGAAGGARVSIDHAQFKPSSITIAVGETVTWSNDDEDGHSITADDGSFDSHPDCSEEAQSKCLQAGGSWSRTFDKAGRYPYRSRTEGQKGVVVVRG